MVAKLEDTPDDDCRDLPDFADPRVSRIVHLALEGCTWEQIAAELKISIRTVYNLRQEYDLDPLVDYLSVEGSKATIRAYLSMRRKAFMKAGKLLEHDDPNVALGAVKEALAHVAKREHAANDASKTPDGSQAARPERSRDELVRRAGAAARKLKGG